MATFIKIISKFVNLDNNIFAFNYDKTDKISGTNKLFFSMLINIKHHINFKNKFDFLYQTLNNFYFSNDSVKQGEFFEMFNKIQKIYYVLNKFVYNYKYKKAKLIVNTDFQLNEIKENDPNVLCIYHINAKYLFKIEDLIKLIYISLTNTFSFFTEPISIKNPYNNIPFGKSILYYIYSYLASYAKIRFIKSEHLDIFLKFKQSNFNMTKLVNKYEYIFREYGIVNFLNNSTKESIIEQIKIMIQSFNTKVKISKKKICISEDFPQDDLIRIMKPYLLLKLTSFYSLIHKNKNESKNMLHKKLIEFQNFNPNFGRKIYKMKTIVKDGKSRRIISNIEFNMNYKTFNTFQIEKFMNNHLTYKYDGYEYENNNESDEASDEEPEITLTILTNLTLNTDQYINDDNENQEDHEDEDDEDYKDEEDDDEDEEEYDEGLYQEGLYEEDYYDEMPDEDSIS